MRNNTKEANGKGFPLKITAVEVKVVDNPDAAAVSEHDISFVKHIMPTLDWPALVQVRRRFSQMYSLVDGDSSDHHGLTMPVSTRRLPTWG